MLRVQRLTDTGGEISRTKENDIDHSEPVADHKVVTLQEGIQPFEAILRPSFEAISGFRQTARAFFEQIKPLGIAETIAQIFGDPELDAPLPHTGFSALFGGRSDQCLRRVLFFKMLEDSHGFGDYRPVIELKSRHLAARVFVGVGRPAINAST